MAEEAMRAMQQHAELAQSRQQAASELAAPRRLFGCSRRVARLECSAPGLRWRSGATTAEADGGSRERRNADPKGLDPGGRRSGSVGTALKYGLRDAGAAFDRKVLDVMNLMGVSLDKFSICVGYRKVMDTLVSLVRWGDDFSFSGRRSLCNAFRDDLGKHLLFKTTAVLGPNAEMGDAQEAIRLNRLLRLYPPGAEGGERWELEADPRHVEILVSQMAWVTKESFIVEIHLSLLSGSGRCDDVERS